MWLIDITVALLFIRKKNLWIWTSHGIQYSFVVVYLFLFFHFQSYNDFFCRCQPWTITLTGVLAISFSWVILQSVLVTAIVGLLICSWWYIFLYSYPKVLPSPRTHVLHTYMEAISCSVCYFLYVLLGVCKVSMLYCFKLFSLLELEKTSVSMDETHISMDIFRWKLTDCDEEAYAFSNLWWPFLTLMFY